MASRRRLAESYFAFNEDVSALRTVLAAVDQFVTLADGPMPSPFMRCGPNEPDIRRDSGRFSPSKAAFVRAKLSRAALKGGGAEEDVSTPVRCPWDRLGTEGGRIGPLADRAQDV
jgi:hypothetical protein